MSNKFKALNRSYTWYMVKLFHPSDSDPARYKIYHEEKMSPALYRLVVMSSESLDILKGECDKLNTLSKLRV